MFNASFDIKCLIFSIVIFSHSKPSLGHLFTASNFFDNLLYSFIASKPQDGHFLGKTNFFVLVFLFFLSNETTCGITSPALYILNFSPILISFLNISSSLCSVAFETITPPIFTGRIFATGVRAPVLPI